MESRKLDLIKAKEHGGIIECTVKTLDEAALLVENLGVLENRQLLIRTWDQDLYIHVGALETSESIRIYQNRGKDSMILELHPVADTRLASGYLFPEKAKKHQM